jgi:hypothetical protein
LSRRATALASALLVLALLLVAAKQLPSARAETAGENVILAAGDVASCGPKPGDEATAALLQKEPKATVAMLGDGAYPSGDLYNYQQCYTPSWGSADIQARVRPVVGNHEYDGGTQAADYFTYFGASAGPGPGGYYSYDLAGWHIIVLNANCAANVPNMTPSNPDGCSADSAQGRWLKADLAAHATPCMMAMWHEPRFFSVAVPDVTMPGNLQPSSDPTMNGLWQILQNAGVDAVITGHWHDYERFPRLSLPPGQTVGPGVPDADGMREFVVGTGGGPHHKFLVDAQGNPTRIDPNSEKRIERIYGVLRLELEPTGYDWQFLSSGMPNSAEPKAGTVLDSGSDTCTPGTPPPTTSPTTDPTTPPSTGPGSTTTTGPDQPGGHASGYWMAGADGRVYPFGAAQSMGDAPPAAGTTTVRIEPTPARDGYWVADSAGNVAARGAAPPLGSVGAGQLAPGERVTSLSATPTGKGYWIFTNRGRVITFGDAVSYGDMAKVALNGPVLDSIPTPSGRGYYMVASDGGIFAFGDGVFRGSMGGRRLNAPVQSLVPVPNGAGYWLVAADGGVFAFGDAPFRGSMGGVALSRPITGMVPYGNGYLMVGEDGGIFSFSNQDFAGSLGANPPARPIVSVAAL